jgi:methylenetetrahydrofolate dehydrogenase (NADP+)/methenyltetrahydrofolate cyclohydrolase
VIGHIGLVTVLVGDDPASEVYIRLKHKAAVEAGFDATDLRMPTETTQQELLGKLAELNASDDVDAILVQLPLPSHLDEEQVIRAVSPAKDVDGFHPMNAGLLAVGHPRFVPCTPLGIMKLLEHEGVSAEGRHAVVVGRSNIVGKPMALLLLQKGATVTICNSRTPDLGSMTRQAEILVVAAGKPKLITAEMLSPGAIVIDVGINRLADGKLSGDVDFSSVLGTAARITPVPGGVGPMTIAMLLENTVASAERALAASRTRT